MLIDERKETTISYKEIIKSQGESKFKR